MSQRLVTLFSSFLSKPSVMSPDSSNPPQSDRIVCNKATVINAESAFTSFSIRNRIESSATSGVKVPIYVAPLFQYPQSDRIVCNKMCC